MDHGSPPPSRPTGGPGAGPNLVFGLIALQNHLIDRETLRAAFQVWVGDRSRTIGQILVDRGALDPEDHSFVEAKVRDHLRDNAGDVSKSLTGLGLAREVAARSARGLDDTEIQSILSGFGPDVDPGEATAYFEPVDELSSEGRRYRKIAMYREGGLGVVFRGRDDELNRDVAVKEIREARADDPRSRARLVMEAEITGRLEHPGIVSVYSKGTTARGRPYYVMRFIRGRELKAAIEEFHATDWSPRPPEARAASLRGLLTRFVAACNTIAYAHSRKVIHRDIKPANILLGPFGETLVIDWGLAKPVDDVGEITVAETTIRPSASGEADPTRDGSVMGSAPYLSPEQAAGDLDRVGPASDIFLLGSTLYEILTGKAPYQEPGRAASLARARTRTFARPREVDPAIPAALEAICLKAMARAPDDRYHGAIALARDVDRWLADEPVTVHPESLAAQLARWGRRHRAWVVAAAAALVLVSAVSVASALAVNRARRDALAARDAAGAAKAEADIQRDLATEHFRKAVATNEILLGLGERVLGTVPGMEAEWAAMARKSLDDFTAFVARFPDDRELNLARVRASRLVGNIHRGLNRFAEADAFYRETIALLDGLCRLRPADLEARNLLAELNLEAGESKHLSGHPVEGEPFAREASRIAETLRAEQPEEKSHRRTEARCCYGLAEILAASGRPHDAVDLFSPAVAILRPIADDPTGDLLSRIELGMILAEQAGALRDDGRLVESEASAREALTRLGPVVDLTNDNNCRFLLASSRIELGRSLVRDPSRIAEAEASFDAAIADLTRLRLGFPGRPDYRKYLALAHRGRAAARSAAGRAVPAEDDLKLARGHLATLMKQAPGMADYEGHLGRTLADLARLTLARGDKLAARGLLEEAASRLNAAVAANPGSSTDRAALDRIGVELRAITGANPNAPGP